MIAIVRHAPSPCEHSAEHRTGAQARQPTRDAGVTRPGCGTPNCEREGVLPVDRYLRIIEETKREVWPDATGVS